MDRKTTIAIYMDLLMGKVTEKQFILSGNQEEAALDMIRFALEYIPHWSPVDFIQHADAEITQKLKIDFLVARKYIRDVVSDWGPGRYALLMEKAYPNRGFSNRKAQLIAAYDRALESGTKMKLLLVNDGFSDKVSTLLVEFINRHVAMQVDGDNKTEELYRIFGTKRLITPLLKEAGLLKLVRVLYPEPIDFLHDNLPFPDSREDICRDNFFYGYYKYINLTKRIKWGCKKTPLTEKPPRP